MCTECLKVSCDSRCPNAPEEQTVYTCKHCKQPIVVGDSFIRLQLDRYHEECFSDLAEEILFEEYGAVKEVAEALEL